VFESKSHNVGGNVVGTSEGSVVGTSEGCVVGTPVGVFVGISVGASDGWVVGACVVGTRDGALVVSTVVG